MSMEAGLLLPSELLLQVFVRLPQVDLLQASLVCTQWHAVAIDPTLWTYIGWETELACRWGMVTLPQYKLLLKRPQFKMLRKLKPPFRAYKKTSLTAELVNELSTNCKELQTLDLSCWDAYADGIHNFARINSLRGIWLGSIKAESHAHLKLCKAVGDNLIDLRVRALSWHDADILLTFLHNISISCANIKILYVHLPLYNGLRGQIVDVLRRFSHLQQLSLCWREGTHSTHWQGVYEEIVHWCEKNAEQRSGDNPPRQQKINQLRKDGVGVSYKCDTNSFRRLRTIVFTQRDYVKLRKPLKLRLRKLMLLEVLDEQGTYPHLFPDEVMDYSLLENH